MVAPTFSCDRDRLVQLLEGRLNEKTAHELTLHLESCSACCGELEAMAANERWWHQAHRFLKEPDDEQPASDVEQSDLPQACPRHDTDAALDQLVVEFLDRSDNPAMLGRLGDHEILEVLGCGGMGVVLKGYDAQLNRYVAVKVLAPCYANVAAARKRFAREAQAAAAVVHQHVVPIHAVDASGQLPYLVMPLVACESLQQRIEEQGALDVKDILRIGMQAADGLSAAHAQGLIHRDIKPANILLEKGLERVLLTDFGLARAIDDATLTHSGVVAGTPQYMSPEQAGGEPIDHRSDLFSLGSVLYAMCTGRAPFRAETMIGILRRVTDTTPRWPQEINPDIPPWLCHIVARLQAKDPAMRFQSAEEVAELLEKCLAHVQHPTSVPLPDAAKGAIRPRRPVRRRILFLVGGLLLLGGSCAAAAWALLDTTGDSSTPAARSGDAAPQQPADDATAGSIAGEPPQQNSYDERSDGFNSLGASWGDDVRPQLEEIEHQLRQLERATQRDWLDEERGLKK